jgi:hypothetical protein
VWNGNGNELGKGRAGQRETDKKKSPQDYIVLFSQVYVFPGECVGVGDNAYAWMQMAFHSN